MVLVENLTSFGNRFGLARLMNEQLLYPCDYQHNVRGRGLSQKCPVFAELPSYPRVLAKEAFSHPKMERDAFFLT